MKKNYKNVTIAFSEEFHAAIVKENRIGSMSYTIKEMLENYLTLRNVSLAELKGVFTEDEWKFFAESLNGSLVEGMFRFSKSAFIAHCEDAIKYEGTQFSVPLEDIKKKVEGLKGANMDALYSRVEQFWENCSTINLDDWAKF